MAQKQIIADLTNICVLTFWILSCTDIWSGSANSATDNDWTLDQHAFKVTTPGFTDYKVKIGDQIDFEFEMTAKQNITDDILIGLSVSALSSKFLFTNVLAEPETVVCYLSYPKAAFKSFSDIGVIRQSI